MVQAQVLASCLTKIKQIIPNILMEGPYFPTHKTNYVVIPPNSILPLDPHAIMQIDILSSSIPFFSFSPSLFFCSSVDSIELQAGKVGQNYFCLVILNEA